MEGGGEEGAEGEAEAAGGRWPRRITLFQARSRLYRKEILQENNRWKALAEIFTMHSFAQLCNLNFLSNNLIFAKHFVKFCKIQQI